MNGEVLIVDEFTGRILPGRRYNEGMHQAIEAKEGVEIKQENQTLATITLQNYFRLYDKLGRDDRHGDDRGRRVRPDLQARRGADPDQPADDPRGPARPGLQDRGGQVRRRVEDIAERHDEGPAGPGRHHSAWRRASTCRELLQAARRPARGAQRQVPRAGGRDHRPGRPQGRGHGRDQHGRSRHRHHARRQPRVRWPTPSCAQRGLSPIETPEEYEAAWPGALEKAKAAVAAEHEEVVGLGGLYVLGTERHESRRIDNQLRGRSGRQGDPGESRFYLSLGDDLMRLFNARRVESIMDAAEHARTTSRSSPRW